MGWIVDQVDAKAVSPWIINGDGNGNVMFRQGWLNQQVVDWISHMATFFLFYFLNGSFLGKELMVFFQLDLHNARSSVVVYWYLNYGCLSADFGWSLCNYENKD